MRRLVLPLLLLASPAAATSTHDATWTQQRVGRAELRVAEFVVSDAACAYRVMSDLPTLVKTFTFVDDAEVHHDDGRRQHVTFTEHFFLVGKVQSRYERSLDGDHRLEWVLQDGRAKRHDGSWTINTDEAGAHIRFSNLIESKSRFDQGIVNRVQANTMEGIVAETQAYCGVP